MSLFTLIITLVVIGVIMYCINRWVPMDANWKKLINVVVVIAVVAWLIYTFVGGHTGDIRVPTLK